MHMLHKNIGRGETHTQGYRLAGSAGFRFSNVSMNFGSVISDPSSLNKQIAIMETESSLSADVQ